MVEVLTMLGGTVRDRAQADTAEGALLAARTLLTDAREACATGTTAWFYGPDGMLVRGGLTLSDLSTTTEGATR